MNVTELARRLKIPTKDLRELLPKIGYSEVGSKAIKINDKLAFEIIQNWHRLMDNYNKKLEYNKKQAEKEREENQNDDIVELQKEVSIPAILTVKQFADLLDMPLKDIINELMKNGILASMNERLDYETAAIIAEDLGFKVSLMEESDNDAILHEKKLSELLKEKSQKKGFVRPPVIVVMGHVDHGKTRLLDTIRKTNVIDTEAGGITQHIGAYQVEKKGKLLTFIDTPGHEAFTAMRSRGAKIADIAILIVAADDGVKPQTVEAIKIIEQAGIPMLVAINKIDKESANIEKVKQELAQYNILAEEWGGDKIMCPISAKFDKGIDELLDNLLLLAEMQEEKLLADPDAEALATVIESHIDKAIGHVATLLIHTGTLKLGDHLLINDIYYGKVKDMRDYTGKSIEEAGPSTPVQIIGFKTAPSVGDIVEASETVDKKILKTKVKKNYLRDDSKALVSSLVNNNDDVAKINIVLKADVLGSLEAIIESLAKIENKDVKVNIISKGLGNVSERDLWQAEASNAIIIAFHVSVANGVDHLAEEQGVEIKEFKIIYDLIAFLEKKMEDALGNELSQENIALANVLAIFKKSKNNTILGAKVIEGNIVMPKNANEIIKVNVLRNKEFITEGKLLALKVGKEDVNEVQKGQECGLSIANIPELELGDDLEFVLEKTEKKKL